jgi:two-component system C4-dicarboxylate transport sensor histidine kinase DctB
VHELAQINRWVLGTSLVRGTVHAVNNVLQTIGSQVEILMQRADLPDDVRQRLDLIAQQNGRAAGLMLEMSSLDRNTAGPVQRTPIRHAVERVIELRRSELGRAQIEVRVSGEGAGECLDAIDGPALTLALLNLVLNAEQALAESPTRRIDVGIERRGRQQLISVSDSGPGIPPDQRDRIFEPFFTTRRPGATLGLGLTVARSLIQEHRGHLVLAETPAGTEGGARFEIGLPAVN